MLTLPLALTVKLASGPAIPVHGRGLGLAAISGAVTSGLGYAIWYRALRSLTSTRAAVVQLCVPVIAAAGAIVFLGETAGLHLVLCGSAIIGGVVIGLLGRVAQRRPVPAAGGVT